MDAITGLILAGGQGRRMGGVDKGLQVLRGRPMIEWVIERLMPQVRHIVINANQNHDRYGVLGHPVVADAVAAGGGGFAGPLAGIQAGLAATTTDLMITVPCDSPFLPIDLVTRLAAARASNDADIAVAKTGQQVHPVFMLVHRRVRPNLEAYLSSGGRKIDAWYAHLRAIEVPFADDSAFANINTRDELASHERRP